METIDSTSREYVYADTEAVIDGVVVDPTADTVQMSFMSNGAKPAEDDWLAASWSTNATTTPDTYAVRCLVGPDGGTIVLQPGRTYMVRIRITHGSTKPVKLSGPIRVV